MFAVEPVPNEKRWSTPRELHINCALDPSNPTENNTTLATAFLAADIDDVYECFVLQLLGELLTSGPNAPFYKSLIETGLGTGFAPSTGRTKNE